MPTVLRERYKESEVNFFFLGDTKEISDLLAQGIQARISDLLPCISEDRTVRQLFASPQDCLLRPTRELTDRCLTPLHIPQEAGYVVMLLNKYKSQAFVVH